jgi:sulfofructose kinase
MKNIDVLCVGATSWDLVFMLDHHPQADEKTIASSHISCGGGPAANAAVTIAKLGLRVAFCGYLGNDIFGRLHAKELQNAGINQEFIIQGDQPAPLSVVLVKPTGERTLVNHRISKPLPADSFDFKNIRPKVILFDGHEAHISRKLLKLNSKWKAKTILDAGSINTGTSFLYDKVDYLVCSEVFAHEMTGLKDSREALDALFKNNKNVVLTLGAKGLIWKKEHGNGALPAYKINAVDTTGAGDVFHGAFAARLARYSGWSETLRFASAAAALCCTKHGARPSIPSEADIHSFLTSVT